MHLNAEDNLLLLRNADTGVIQTIAELPQTDETSVAVARTASDVLSALNPPAANDTNPIPPANSEEVEFINKLAALVVTRGAEFETKLMDSKRGHDNFQ